MKQGLLFVLSLFVCATANAQLPTPYSTGFDNASERSGWHEIRTGSTAYFDWTYADAGAATPPTMLTHDYPVGNMNGDTVEDWFISPYLVLNASNTLAFKYYIYSINGSTTPMDYFGVWLSTESDDPAAGDYVEIANLTNAASASFEWRDTSNIAIPSTPAGYIAFRYRAVNNWFVANVDSVVVDAETKAPTVEKKVTVQIFPTLATQYVTVQSNEALSSIALVDALGRKLVYKSRPALFQRVDVSQLDPGVYWVVADGAKGSCTVARFMKQ